MTKKIKDVIQPFAICYRIKYFTRIFFFFFFKGKRTCWSPIKKYDGGSIRSNQHDTVRFWPSVSSICVFCHQTFQMLIRDTGPITWIRNRYRHFTSIHSVTNPVLHFRRIFRQYSNDLLTCRFNNIHNMPTTISISSNNNRTLVVETVSHKLWHSVFETLLYVITVSSIDIHGRVLKIQTHQKFKRHLWIIDNSSVIAHRWNRAARSFSRREHRPGKEWKICRH